MNSSNPVFSSICIYCRQRRHAAICSLPSGSFSVIQTSPTSTPSVIFVLPPQVCSSLGSGIQSWAYTSVQSAEAYFGSELTVTYFLTRRVRPETSLHSATRNKRMAFSPVSFFFPFCSLKCFPFLHSEVNCINLLGLL